MSDTNNVFQNIFHDKQIQSKNSLDEFLAESGEKQTHNLRTSFRRLEAVYSILPNSCKGKKTDNFVSSYKSLFKKNSFIRDSDVILKKLLDNGFNENSEIVKHVIEQKNTKLKKIRKEAKKISRLKIADLKNTKSEKINQKYEKQIFLLITKIQESISIVISDESKIKELHSMRKTAKKLRYIFEVDPTRSYQHVIENMKSFQELLGQIHDFDITVDFLNKHSKKDLELTTLINQEKKIRSEIYKKLASSLSAKI